MRAKHACKCITRLIVTGTRHHYAGWAWSCINFVRGHSAGTARKTPPLEAAVGIQGRAFRLLLIVLTPSNAPKCRGSKRGTHRPPGWRPRARGDKIKPSYLTPAFSGAQKWADWLHDRCLLRCHTGVGIGNSPKSCPAHALRTNTPSLPPNKSVSQGPVGGVLLPLSVLLPCCDTPAPNTFNVLTVMRAPACIRKEWPTGVRSKCLIASISGQQAEASHGAAAPCWQQME